MDHYRIIPFCPETIATAPPRFPTTSSASDKDYPLANTLEDIIQAFWKTKTWKLDFTLTWTKEDSSATITIGPQSIVVTKFLTEPDAERRRVCEIGALFLTKTVYSDPVSVAGFPNTKTATTYLFNADRDATPSFDYPIYQYTADSMYYHPFRVTFYAGDSSQNTRCGTDLALLTTPNPTGINLAVVLKSGTVNLPLYWAHGVLSFPNNYILTGSAQLSIDTEYTT